MNDDKLNREQTRQDIPPGSEEKPSKKRKTPFGRKKKDAEQIIRIRLVDIFFRSRLAASLLYQRDRGFGRIHQAYDKIGLGKGDLLKLKLPQPIEERIPSVARQL